jgi:hypothetical protein
MERFSRQEDKKYTKIYGAVAWPGKHPGFAVVIGQSRELHLGGHDMIFIDEFESGDTKALVRACGGLDYFYRPDLWIGDNKNDAADKFIREMNKENQAFEMRIEGHRPFKMRRSPLLDMKNAFAYFFPVLKELLNPDRRRLFLKDGSKLKVQMYQPQESDLPTIEFGHYPAIEALAFAVFELDQVRDKQKRQTHAVNEYKQF